MNPKIILGGINTMKTNERYELNKNLGGFYYNIITQDIDFYKNNFKKLIC